MASRLKAASAKADAHAGEASVARDAVGTGAVPDDYVEKNRAPWDRWALHYTATGRKAWMEAELKWGIWGIPETDLRLLEGLPDGADVIELGGGAAAVPPRLVGAGLGARAGSLL